MEKYTIKNIVFDFGDIFIDLDKPATLNRIQQLGLQELTPEMVKMNETYEKGLVSTQDFVKYYHHLLPHTSREQLIEAWNAIILDFPEYRLKFIEDLSRRKQYRLFLLSNTNELHIAQVKKRMTEDRYKRFKSCFEQFYLSHEIYLRKPDAEIFQYVTKQNRLIPQQTLFIDDTLENVKASETIGWNGWHLIPGEDDIVDLPKKNFLKK
ncbi:HAD family hydrolase [Flavobacteriaceae bacterium M23B6Z8]